MYRKLKKNHEHFMMQKGIETPLLHTAPVFNDNWGRGFFGKKDIIRPHDLQIPFNLQVLLVAIFLTVFIFSFLSSTQAGTIWRIGDPNINSFDEWDSFLDMPEVHYEVPEDWESNKQAWKSFPEYLYPPDLPRFPDEIHITYTSLKDYRDPVLRIKAYSYESNYKQELAVLKGEEKLFIGKACLINIYVIYEFHLGFMRKGHHKIIIRNQRVADNNNWPIYFDYLELDDQDEDGDGSLDSEEEKGDMDQDGIENKSDPDTCTILIQSLDKSGIEKRITFDLQEKGDLAPQFRHLTRLDQDSPEIPQGQPEDIFFYYGLFMANIQVLNEEGRISLKVYYPEAIHFLAKFYLYSGLEGWQEVPMEINGNSIVVSIEAKKEWNGEEEEEEGQQGVKDHRLITIVGGLAYPRGMDITLEEEKTCFLSFLSFPFLPLKLMALFFGFPLILFLFLQYSEKRIYASDKFNQSKDNLPNKLLIKRYMFILTILFALILKIALTSATAITGSPVTEKDMKMSTTPNPVGSGARAIGMGSAFIAVADDATAASWNPGGLVKLKRWREISIVGSYFSRDISYNNTSAHNDIEDLSPEQFHLNYLSAVFPFMLFQKTLVFSMNYQQLFEFSQNISSKWKYIYKEPVTGIPIIDIPMRSDKKQKGTLNTLTPALAIQLIPSLYFGLAANFWQNDALNNYCENINTVRSIPGEGMDYGWEIETYAKIYEKYEFNGFNINLGVLWQPNHWLTLGGVLKTPFTADIRHEYRFISIIEYPQDPARNIYYYPDPYIEDLHLKMPASYGLGAAIRLSDRYLLALDIYHTHWEDYILYSPSGEQISLINNKPKDEANIKATTQIRLGTEYIIVSSKPAIPIIRCGIFYDPEPAGGRVDDFYGASLGMGLKFKNIAFDIAYQYRFGRKKSAEQMFGTDISSDIKQHYLYTSMIFYF